MSSFVVDSIYNFNTLAPAILGASFNRATVLGIISYSVAKMYINIETNHANIYPYLPAGTVNDPKTYKYLLIKTESGEETVLALPWINTSTIEEITTKAIYIVVKDIANEDTVKIRDALLMMGFNNLSISIK